MHILFKKCLYRDPPRKDIEYSLKNQRHEYGVNTEFFKCPVLQAGDELPAEFNIEEVPTVVFYRNGEECYRLVEPKEDTLFKKLNELSQKSQS